MRILTVIPITHNPRLNELTYFSIKEIPLGSVVQVPLRSKEVPALVIHSDDASNMKAVLRGGNFSLKRIGVAPPLFVVPQSFVLTATEIAHYYGASTGAILSSMLPKALLDTSEQIMTKQIPTSAHKEKSPAMIADTYALQASYEDRVALYKNTMREAFAKGESLTIVAPTIASVHRLSELLAANLTARVHTLTSKNTKAKQLKILKELHNAPKPVLLIATPKYALLFRDDARTIIIEDEASTSYETLRRPYISLVTYLSTYAKLSGLKLILGGTTLSTSVHLAIASGAMSMLAPPTAKARSTVQTHIIDTRRKELPAEATAEQKIQFEKDSRHEKGYKKPFTALSNEAHTIISNAIASKKSLFILAPRRGLAPLTVCRDCKTPVLCNSCDTPITLYKKKDGSNEFLCHKCGESKDTDTTCSYCDSWRLDTLGIGIEMIEGELQQAYPNTKIHKIDKQTTKTPKQVQDVIKDFSKHGGILLGTPLALPALPKVSTIIVASLDAMLSVPSFEIDEKVFALLLKIKDTAEHDLHVQTRMPKRSVLVRAKEGDIATFMREELALRKVLKYPPYTVMVKITRIASKRQIIQDFQNIMPKLEEYKPRVFKQFQQITPSKFALHALLRIPTSEYPHAKLTELLKSIQPLFEVRVDVG